jgi:peptidoglycan/LPS O-acetylase OafA/YrhL
VTRQKQNAPGGLEPPEKRRLETAGGFEAARLPSLDGFRGLLILIVVMVHAFGSPGLPRPGDRLMNHFYFVGWLSVGLFFCISGYLISGLLLDERAARGAISLRRFYMRRVLRIFPVYYVYVVTLIALGALGLFAIPWQQSVQALTYTRDFFVGSGIAFGVAWSLAIEEQFYLAWPPILARLSVPAATKVLAVVFFLAPAIRYGVFRWLAGVGAPQLDLIWRLPTGVMDFLIAGCLLAIAERHPFGLRLLDLARRLRGALVATVVLVAAYQLPGAYDNTFAVGAWVLPSVCAVWTVLVIRRYVASPGLPLGRLLNSRVMVRLGHLSYSLYLWHIVFVNPYYKSVLNRFPLSVVLSLGVAWLSREYIEKPFLRLKTRYQGARPGRSALRDDSHVEARRLV